MSYRPEGFINQKDNLQESKAPINVQIAHSAGFSQGFEAGADAILEALRKEGVKGVADSEIIGSEILFYSDDEVSDMLGKHKGKTGHLIFIPEEE